MKSEAADTINEDSELFEPPGLVCADQNQRLAGMGEECGGELLIGDSALVQTCCPPKDCDRSGMPVSWRQNLLTSAPPIPLGQIGRAC